MYNLENLYGEKIMLMAVVVLPGEPVSSKELLHLLDLKALTQDEMKQTSNSRVSGHWQRSS